jgi:hypothetical protein
MIKTVPLKKTLRTLNMLPALAALTLALAANSSALASGDFTTGSRSVHSSLAGSDTLHSILVNKSKVSKKIKIRLYPDARQQVLFFSATGEDGKIYQLYLFDMDGKLMNQTSIRNKETTVLNNITEGSYFFEVFSDDEHIESGQLTAK